MKKTLTAALIAALASPAVAGGPVILEEGAPAAEEATQGNILVPLLVLVAIGLLVGNDGGDAKQSCPPTRSCA